MPLRRQEIRDFITACEKIQALLAQGELLSGDEIEIIEMCCNDLFSNMKTSKAAA
jgi:hypothetical protein